MKTNSTLESKTTPAYTAPEVINEQPSTSKVDMWALGIILYQLLASSNNPFQSTTKFEWLKSIKENEPAPLPSQVSSFVSDLLKMLLNKNPNDRPAAEQLL